MNNGTLKYDINILCSYISNQTHTPIHQIKQKPQITYIDNYLRFFNDEKSIHIVYENEYIEQHYIEDYSEYFSRCFHDYKRTCSRIHFFAFEKNIDFCNELNSALNNKESEVNSSNYIGFIVIRPIPYTFLAKICFRTHSFDENRIEKFRIKKKYEISLFGIDLNVETIAFQEQDKVLSVCATSSLWSFLYAHPSMSVPYIPSPSSITKKSYFENNGNNKEFPTHGLSTDMICFSLKNNGLYTQAIDFSKKSKKYGSDTKKIVSNYLKEIIFSYCASGIPLIFGVSVRDAKTNKYKGLHAITVLGYSLEDNVIYNDSMNMISHNLKNIYIHDDRIGMYAKAVLNHENGFAISIEENTSASEINIYDSENYSVDTVIIGVYHKIRITYKCIRDTCENLSDILIEYAGNELYASVIKNFIWDLRIKNVSQLKREIRKSEIKDKDRYLKKSFPKYIWCAKVYINNKAIFELVFDATDISQGDIFLDILPIDAEICEHFITILHTFSNQYFNVGLQDKLLSKESNNIWGIVKFFKKRENYLDSLNKLFGCVKMPMSVKPTEIISNTILNQCEARLDQKSDFFSLNQELPTDNSYIWVIDAEGFLCIGVEVNGSEKGHPTLTDGMPARIGGTLVFENMEWVITPFSGRYSKEYTKEEKSYFLKNALTYKFAIFFPDDNFSIHSEFC